MASGGECGTESAIKSDEPRLLHLCLQRSDNRVGELGEPEGSARLIHLAVANKARGCLENLLGVLKPFVDALNGNRETALFVALSNGWIEGVEILLNAGADITKTTDGFETSGPLVKEERQKRQQSLVLCGFKFRSVARFEKILLAAQAMADYKEVVNVKCKPHGITPLLMAVTKKNLEAVEMLLKIHADVSLCDKEGLNVLHWAVTKQSPTIIEALFRAKPEEIRALTKQQCRGKYECTPLSLAMHLGDMECVNLLMKTVKASCFDTHKLLPGGICLKVPPKGPQVGGTEITLSVTEADDFEVVKHCSVLHLASLLGKEKILTFFIERLYKNDKDLNKLVLSNTEDGMSPLSFALKKHQIELVYALLAAGADLSTPYKDSKKTDMDIMILYLPSAKDIITHVLNCSLSTHKERGRHVEIDYSILIPTECCDADNECDNNSIATPPQLPRTEAGVSGRQGTALVSGDTVIDVERRQLFHDLSPLPEETAQDIQVLQVPQSLSPQQVSPQAGDDNAIDVESRQHDEEAAPLIDNNHVVHIESQSCVPPAGDEDRSSPQRGTQRTTGIAAQDSDSTGHNHFGVLKELQKMGKSLNHMQILEHPLVESYLFLYWKKIKCAYILLGALNLTFALLLSVTAAVVGADYYDNADNADNDYNDNDNTYFSDRNKTEEFVEDPASSTDHQHPILKISVFVFMLPLLIYEAQCFYTLTRPFVYWVETVLKVFYLSLTICWLASDFKISLGIAVVLAWIQIAVLILEVRQCHGYGRLVIHFVKTLFELKDVIFGIVIGVLTILIMGGGGYAPIKLNFDGSEIDRIFADVIFSSIIFASAISFMCCLLILLYACFTFKNRYPRDDKFNLNVHQIQFLEVYENYLLGKKPRLLAVGEWGIIYYAFKGILIFASYFGDKHRVDRWKPLQGVKRKCLVYPLGTGSQRRMDSETERSTNVVFPDELQLEITLKGIRNWKSLEVCYKERADAARKKKDSELRKIREKDDSSRIENIESMIVQICQQQSQFQRSIHALHGHSYSTCSNIVPSPLGTFQRPCQRTRVGSRRS